MCVIAPCKKMLQYRGRIQKLSIYFLVLDVSQKWKLLIKKMNVIKTTKGGECWEIFWGFIKNIERQFFNKHKICCESEVSHEFQFQFRTITRQQQCCSETKM